MKLPCDLTLENKLLLLSGGVQVALARYGPTEMEYKSLGNFKFPNGHM